MAQRGRGKGKAPLRRTRQRRSDEDGDDDDSEGLVPGQTSRPLTRQQTQSLAAAAEVRVRARTAAILDEAGPAPPPPQLLNAAQQEQALLQNQQRRARPAQPPPTRLPAPSVARGRPSVRSDDPLPVAGRSIPAALDALYRHRNPQHGVADADELVPVVPRPFDLDTYQAEVDDVDSLRVEASTEIELSSLQQLNAELEEIIVRDVRRNGDRQMEVDVYQGRSRTPFYEYRPRTVITNLMNIASIREIASRLVKYLRSKVTKGLRYRFVVRFIAAAPYTISTTSSWGNAELTLVVQNNLRAPWANDGNAEGMVNYHRAPRSSMTQEEYNAQPPTLWNRSSNNLWNEVRKTIRKYVRPRESFRYTMTAWVVIRKMLPNGAESFVRVFIPTSYFGRSENPAPKLNKQGVPIVTAAGQPVFSYAGMVNGTDAPSLNLMTDDMKRRLTLAVEEFVASGQSQLEVVRVDSIIIGVQKTNMQQQLLKNMPGGSFIPTPHNIAQRHAVLNVENTDNDCFLYSLLASQYVIADDHAQRLADLSPSDPQYEQVRKARQRQRKAEFRNAARPATYRANNYYDLQVEKWHRAQANAGDAPALIQPKPVQFNVDKYWGTGPIMPLSPTIGYIERASETSIFIYEAYPRPLSDEEKEFYKTRPDQIPYVVRPLRKGAVVRNAETGRISTYPNVVRLLYFNTYVEVQDPDAAAYHGDDLDIGEQGQEEAPEMSEGARVVRHRGGIGHYVAIRDMSALMKQQLYPNHNGRFDICDICLRAFVWKTTYLEHLERGCLAVNSSPFELPFRDEAVKQFSAYHCKEDVPWFVAADTESTLMPPEEAEDGGAEILNVHVPHTFCMTLVSPYFPHARCRSITDDNPERLMVKLVEEARGYNEMITSHIDRIRDQRREAERIAMEGAVECCKCGDSYTDEQDPPSVYYDIGSGSILGVVHKNCNGYHNRGSPEDPLNKCHICEQSYVAEMRGFADFSPYSGDFLGFAHEACIKARRLVGYNIGRQKGVKAVPLVWYFHNLRGYDGKLLLSLSHMVDNCRMNVIHNTSERYISIRFTGPDIHIEFRDSMQLGFSGIGSRGLDSTIKLISKEIDDKYKAGAIGHAEWLQGLRRLLPTTSAHYPDDERFELCRRKQAFPYEHCSSYAVYDEGLPPPVAFASTLRGTTGIGPRLYARVQQFYERMQCSNLGDLEREYCQLDVCLLADCILSHRNTARKSPFGLDPLWYLTAPAYAWACMLYFTKVRLDLFCRGQEDMHLFTRRSIRGGHCGPVTRYTKFNDPRNAAGFGLSTQERETAYDPTQPESIGMYGDVNSLYATMMLLKPLPKGNYAWVQPEAYRDIGAFLSGRMREDPSVGYLLEVDLEYPESTHDRLDQYAPCSSSLEVTMDMFSDWQSEHVPQHWAPHRKLVQSLLPKKNYVVSSAELANALDLGVRVTRIHRALSYTQSMWMAPYINECLKLRAASGEETMKAFYKLMNNSVFGKCIQDQLKQAEKIVFVRNEKERAKYANDPRFCRFETIVPDKLSLFWLKAAKVKLDMPIMIGSMILSHSKVWMSKIHYYIKDCFPPNAYDMLYTDTDSFMMKFTHPLADTQRILKSMDAHVPFPEHFARGTALWDAKKPGLLKDENGGEPMFTLVAPAPKTYSLRVVGKRKDAGAEGKEPTTSDEEEAGVEDTSAADVLPQEAERDELEQSGKAPTMKAKGVFSSVLKKQVTDADYADVVLKSKIVSVGVTQIQSHRLKVRTLHSNKVAANNFYDKRAILPDGINTRAYGHYSLPKQQTTPMDQEPDSTLQEELEQVG